VNNNAYDRTKSMLRISLSSSAQGLKNVSANIGVGTAGITHYYIYNLVASLCVYTKCPMVGVPITYDAVSSLCDFITFTRFE